ncbi:hypothetical protein MMC06_004483 [Schaereria dolodes]|nr:hypothetical protein [Schaereria dolodes]
MPSFYPNTLPRQMPLTPPDYCGHYPNSSSGPMQSTNMYDHNSVASHYGSDHHESCEPSQRTTQSSMPSHTRAVFNVEHERQNPSTFMTTLGPVENPYGHSAAPILPPVRAPDHSFDNEQAHFQNLLATHPPVQAQPKEEKAVGGVAAHLDYEMEQMVDFVSEMAQGMYDLYQSRICIADIDIIRSVHPNAAVSPAFRKYISQILSSTRLPSSTILLGLHYLATRMGMLSASGRYTSGNGQVYRMVTIALLLGSKFLDDMTFQNRSWSEVSNIPCTELNDLEIEWLLAINWDMHIDLDDPQGFTRWIDHWQRWQAKKVEITLDSLKLTPLDANIRRQRSSHKQHPPAPLYLPSYSDPNYGFHTNEHAQPQWQTSRYDQWGPIRSMMERSPPSAPGTGSNTPDYYGRPNNAGYGQAPSALSMRTIPPPAQIMPSSAQLSAYHAAYVQQYTPTYTSTSWNIHGVGCGCGYCLPPHHDRYAMAHGYGAQSVAG